MTGKKYKKLSLFLCLFFINYVVLISFPFVHNLDADLNIWNVKLVVVNDVKHNQEPHPDSACFDYHNFKLIKVGDCPVCQLGSNNNVLLFSIDNSFFYDSFTQISNVYASYCISSHKYNIPQLRAPPLS